VIGLIVAAVSLLVFVLDLLVTPEVDALIVSFVVCGLGLTTGFFLLRSLVPRRDPISLFAGAVGVPLQAAIVETVPRAKAAVQVECRPRAYEREGRCIAMLKLPRDEESHGSESIATYKTHDSAGALVFVTAISVCLILGGRLAGGWAFLSLVVPAGSAVALVLNWSRSRQASNISGYKIPVAGGIIGAAALAGVGIVMVRFHFLREFLGLAILAGGAIALGLNWSRRRRENSSSSFV
jgi:hypothetical protein